MYIVIDIGGTFVKYALMDAAANIVSKGKQPIPRTSLTDFENVIFSIIDEHFLKDIREKY